MNTPDLSTLNHRENLSQWLNENGLTHTMAEIGVAYGGFARIVLKGWNGGRYVLVDPWVVQSKAVYKERTEGIPYNSWYDQCLRLSQEDRRVSILRGFSPEISAFVVDGSLDVAYIDGNHCREAVHADIAAWLPKVKVGGILCGHDYYDATTGGHYCEVKTVVDTWANLNGWKIFTTPCSSWWTVKTAPTT